MLSKRPLSRSIQRALLATAALSAGALQANDARAQDAAADEPASLDVVEVTGSRLKRADAEGATPVIVIDRARIDASGDVSVADLLRDVSQASFGNFRPQSGSSAQSLASIDLRGLGAGRTLVLVDGRRLPTNPMSASAGADLNAIPLAAIERIEILADGASAVYGSDAIGGVVNLVTRRDFDGAELRYGRGSTEVRGGDTEELSVLFGSQTDDTRVLGGFSANKRGMVFTRDQIGGGNPGVTPFGNNYYDWNTGTLAPVPGFDCTQGAFYVLGNGLCSFDFNSVAANEAKIGGKSVFLRADHRINDDWSVYGAASISRVESFGRYAPVPGLVVVDDGTPNDVVQGDGLPTYFYHRFAAAGNRDTSSDGTHADYLVGFEGRLGDRFELDVSLRRTDYGYLELGRGYIVSAIANQLANSGDYDLSDPYGADPSVLSALQATTSREARWRSDEILAVLGVELFEMGGGTSNAVFGAEYRRASFRDQYDSLSEAGQVLGSAGNSAGGDRDTRAAFFEWLLPFTTNFDVTLAGRVDSYSDYGSDFSPKLGLRWQPLDNLILRGSYSQGFRAPGLDILTQKPTFSAEPINDPQTCLVFGQPSGCQLQVNTVSLANAGLDSEKSEQLSLGVVYEPLDWLAVTLDYYRIRIEDRISQVSAQDVLLSVLDPDTYGPPPEGMGVIRGPDGRILQITNGFANRGDVDTDGLDLAVDLRFDLGGAGELDSRLAVTKVLGFEFGNGFNYSQDFAGRAGYPSLRASLANGWTYGDFRVGWDIHHIGDQTDGTGGARIGSYTTHDLQVSWKMPWRGTLTVGATNIGDRYPALVAYDGRPWNFYLYDAYGRTTYLRYSQSF